MARTLTVGQILYTSWGYDQTNVEFFEVTKLVGKASVEVRQLAAVDEYSGQTMTGTKSPKPGQYVGDPIIKRDLDGRVKFESYRRAYPWDGRPKHYSTYA